MIESVVDLAKRYWRGVSKEGCPYRGIDTLWDYIFHHYVLFVPPKCMQIWGCFGWVYAYVIKKSPLLLGSFTNLVVFGLLFTSSFPPRQQIVMKFLLVKLVVLRAMSALSTCCGKIFSFNLVKLSDFVKNRFSLLIIHVTLFTPVVQIEPPMHSIRRERNSTQLYVFWPWWFLALWKFDMLLFLWV